MKLLYSEIAEQNFQCFHDSLDTYYRNAEDKDTPQEEVDCFIRYLFDLIQNKTIDGKLVSVEHDGKTDIAGFILFGKDTEGGNFSELPGYGSILEISVFEKYRKCGIGREIVSYAEEQLRAGGTDKLYVVAYGPAADFWEKCGYHKTDKVAKSGLYIHLKDSEEAKHD